ncbi:MAG: hypothetical protein GXP08_17075 [Gammaproteobacteria bacterium]|nr:hypothetical protein [Gammaproteobacteria bacterium]
MAYSYSYSKAGQSEFESATLSVSVSGSGFIWQPWFILLAVGGSAGLAESDSNTSSSNTSVLGAGSFQITVFPQSRFPFVLAVNRTDSRLESSNLAVSGSQRFTNLRIFLSQTYHGINGTLTRASWGHSEFETADTNSSTDVVNASFRARKKQQRFFVNAGYTQSERSDSASKPVSVVVDFNHDYTPSQDVGVNSLVSFNRNDSDAGQGGGVIENIQASSVFSWRPIDRPYTISGSTRISANESDQAERKGNSLAANIGASYRLTRSLRMVASANVSSIESGGKQAVRSSESVNLSYSSQQFFLAGFNYNWNSSFGLNNSNQKTDEGSTDQQNYSLAGGHSISRSWASGRASSINFALSESANVSLSSKTNDPTFSVGHGLSLGWGFRGVRASTFASVSLSDSRVFSDANANFQSLSAQLSERITLSKISALSASVSFQASRQDSDDRESDDTREQERDGSSPKNLVALVSYRNSRFFGIYALRFSTRLSLNKRLDDNEGSPETTISESRFDYRVGLLTTSATLRIMRSEGGTTTQSMIFTASRSF